MTLRDSRLYRRGCRQLEPWVRGLRARPSADPRLAPDGVAAAFDRDSVDTNWRWMRRELLHAEHERERMRLKCLAECAWYRNARGPALYRVGVGAGEAGVPARTTRATAPGAPPDAEYQFAGLILRDPASDGFLANENYAFIAVGHRHDRLAIEAKSTRHGYSDVRAVDWDSGDAELCLERQGAGVALRARPPGATSFSDIATFERGDLPAVVQLGLMVYAYSEGRGIVDIVGEFSEFGLSLRS